MPLCSASLISLSRSLSASSMANCNKIFTLYYFRKAKTHIQPNLLVTAKPLLSHRWILRPRFQVQLLSAQMSPLIMPSIRTLLLQQGFLPICSQLLSWFLFWWMSRSRGAQCKHLLCPVFRTNKDLICSRFAGSSLGWTNTLR